MNATTETMVHRGGYGGMLTTEDRCDRCGSRAYVLAVFAFGGADLMFCAHHGRQYAHALHRAADVVHDESALVLSTPSS